LRLWYATELLTYHLSDHLPLDVDFATDYLDDTISQASGG
jgi:hypothetical protein